MRIRKPRGKERGVTPASLPMPEILTGTRGKHWEVEAADSGSTSMIERSHKLMRVPTVTTRYCDMCGGDEHETAIQYHEMLHAKLSPMGRPKSTFEVNGMTQHVADHYIQMAEETRIHTIGKRRWNYIVPTGPDYVAGYLTLCPVVYTNAVSNLLEQGNYQGAAEMIYLGQAAFSNMRVDIWEMAFDIGARRLAAFGFDQEDAEHMMSELFGYDLRVALYEVEHYLVRIPVAARPAFIRQMAGLGSVVRNYGTIIKNPMREMTTPQLKRITWRKTLRYAWELQHRFRSLSNDNKIMTDALTEGFENTDGGLPATTGMTSHSLNQTLARAHGDVLDSYISMEQKVKRLVEIGELSAIEAESAAYVRDEQKKRATLGSPRNRRGRVRWGEMVVRQAPLTLRYPVSKQQRGRSRARDEGSIPRNMHRFAVDKRVFGTKLKTYGASILVDDSGSMGFNQRDLKRILDAAPGSVVGMYAGMSRTGMLKVVALNGVRADTKHLGVDGGNNLVDYPALDWLAHQPWPRIWISDGQVVSMSHGFESESVAECERICQEAGIVLVPDAQEAELYITGKKHPPLPRSSKFKRTMKGEPRIKEGTYESNTYSPA